MVGALMLVALLGTAEAADRSLSGTIRDETGAVIPQADVVVRCPRVAERVRSDGRGLFAATGLPVARCTVEVRREGFAVATARVDLRSAGTQTLAIVLLLERVASDVLVTPSRGSEETAFMVPQGASVVDSRELSARPHQLLTQALREEPGVLVQSTTTSQGSPIVRGLTGQRNIYLLDGVRLNTAAWRDGPSQYLAWLPPSMVDRLELVRGPGSVQYGSDAMGAAVNVLTTPPSFASTGIAASGVASATMASAIAGGAFDASVSIGTPRLAVRVGGWRSETDDLRTGGGIDSHSAVTRFLGIPSTVVGSRLPQSGFSQSSGFVVGRARVASDAVLNVSLMHDAQTGASRYDRMLGGAGLYRSAFAPQDLTIGVVRLDRGHTGIFDHVTATLSVNRQSDGRLEQSRPGAAIDEQVTRTTAFGYQTQATRALGSRLMFLAGGEVYDEYIGGSRTITSAGVSRRDRPDIPDGTRYTSSGVFAQTVSSVVPDRLTLRGGIRYGHFAFATTPDLALLVTDERVSTNAFTFNTGVVLRVARTLNVVGSVSRGFRAANAFDLGGVGVSGGGGFEISPSRAAALGALRGTTDGAGAVSSGSAVEALAPEALMSYEAGFKVQARRLAASLIGFDLELRDAIDRRTLIFADDMVGTTIAGHQIVRQDAAGRVFVQADLRPVVTRVNVTRSRIRGFDATAMLAFGGAWSLRSHASMANGRELDSGAFMRRMPPVLGGSMLRWERARWWAEGAASFALAQSRLSDGDLGDARIGGRRSSANVASFFQGTGVDLGLVRDGVLLYTGETLSQVQTRVLHNQPAAAMYTRTPGFLVFGARAGIPIGQQMDLTVIAENLFDRNYRLHGSGVDEPGLNLQVRTRVRF